MTTTDKARAARLRSIANELRDMPGSATDMAAAELEYEADRLDPPAPTSKTVTWGGTTYWRDAAGDIVYGHPGSGRWGAIMAHSRAYIDAVVLPLLADTSDAPIPDETVERAWRVYAVIDDEVPVEVVEKERPNGMHYMRAALEAVRGMPGMAVVRAGKPPEVLEWGKLIQNGAYIPYADRATAKSCCRRNERVVAIIADPGEAKL